MRHDTIVAIATPVGVGGIAVLRLSGADAHALAESHCAVSFSPRRATFALFKDKGTLVDEVVVTYFPAPHSYTGEDVVEISCHGSLYVQQAILQSLIDSGARMADAGEFTQRAFLNGRLDLSQAEAVSDLINSTNQSTHALAISQLRGGYADRLKELRQQFVELASLLELELDFSEEDVEFADRHQLRTIVEDLKRECSVLAESFQQGNAIKNGVPVAIIGRPNVGKSTLLNALLGEDRAIVSDIPGTTRDTVEDTITLQGITFRFVDTAGIRHSDDAIESAGIQRSITAARKARIVLYVVDAAASEKQVSAEIDEISSQISLLDKQLIILRNKSDLVPSEPPQKDSIFISAKYGEGIDELKARLLQDVMGSLESHVVQTSSAIVTNQRHYEALHSILGILPCIGEGIDTHLPADLVVVDIRDALYHLGTITGQVTSPEILHTIFSQFCVGK